MLCAKCGNENGASRRRGLCARCYSIVLSDEKSDEYRMYVGKYHEYEMPEAPEIVNIWGFDILAKNNAYGMVERWWAR